MSASTAGGNRSAALRMYTLVSGTKATNPEPAKSTSASLFRGRAVSWARRFSGLRRRTAPARSILKRVVFAEPAARAPHELRHGIGPREHGHRQDAELVQGIDSGLALGRFDKRGGHAKAHAVGLFASE